MEEKKLEYHAYLSKISDCPSKDCTEKERDSFRWAHNPIKQEDFIPLAFEDSRRVLDETDENQCKSYGLSLYDSLEQAVRQYKAVYENQRTVIRQNKWKASKGEQVVFIRLHINDGVSSESNKNGHFTFYNYMNINILKKVKEIFNIFNTNGDDSNKK